jgi:hypothetical protein
VVASLRQRVARQPEVPQTFEKMEPAIGLEPMTC